MDRNDKLLPVFHAMRTYSDKVVLCSVSSSTELKVTQNEHYHNYFQIYYVTKGCLMHKVDNHFIRLVQGDCFIIPPNVPHKIEIDIAKSSFYSFSFYESFLSNEDLQQPMIQKLFSDLSYNSIMGRLVLTTKEALHMDGLMRMAKDEFDNIYPGFECVLASLLTSILIMLSRVYEREESSAKYKDVVLSTVEYIRNHCTEKLTVKTVASRIYLSEPTFYRIFKQATGQSFKNYLTTVRIQYACDLIRTSKMPILQVAECVGYNNYSSFYRAFINKIQMSPTEYEQSFR